MQREARVGELKHRVGEKKTLGRNSIRQEMVETRMTREG